MQSKIILSTIVALSAANVLPRQTDAGDISACVADAQSLVATVPTPPPALAKDLQKAGADPCNFTPASSLSSQYSSYISKFESWANDHKSLFDKISSECPKQAPQGLPTFSCDGKSPATANGGDSKPTAAQPTGTGVDSSSSAADSTAKPSSTSKSGDGKSAGASVQAGVGAVLGAALLAVVAL